MSVCWLTPQLAEEIIKDDEIFKQTHNIISDIVSGKLAFNTLVENLQGVLIHKDVAQRTKGMQFFTNILKELPTYYLTDQEVNFTSTFYSDRLKDNHNVIPIVLDGYLAIIEMKNYCVQNSSLFFKTLFREVNCQSQVRQDRYNIYLIIKKLLLKDTNYMKTLGPDFVYGVISSMDGERDPRNLLFLFSFLPKFLTNIPLGHLVDEMFEIISCYFPIDFQTSPDNPTLITRQDLADALAPCLCALPEFGEQCLILIIEKLDSALRLAKLDSFKLLEQTCNTFNTQSYTPFLQTLWSIIHREITNKTDNELQMTAHKALSVLIRKLSTTSNTEAFEGFIKCIMKSMQTAIAESTTVTQLTQATTIFLTVANACKESCLIITKSMIPATVVYYGFNTSPKLQVAILEFLGYLYDLAKHWDVMKDIEPMFNDIAQVCLTAVSQNQRDHQIAGFKTLIKAVDSIPCAKLMPFVDVLMNNVKFSNDNELLSVSVNTIHSIAVKYPEEIMTLVLEGNCNLSNFPNHGDMTVVEKRFNLLCNLASIDDFTKIIIEEMLSILSNNKGDADVVVKALNTTMSNQSLYTQEKMIQIESDHGLVDSVVNWLNEEISQATSQNLNHGYALIATTMSNLPDDKQKAILERHTPNILEKCSKDEIYFFVLESLYNSICDTVYNSNFQEIMMLALNLSLRSENPAIRNSACALISHLLNKADFGQKFELLYETLKTYLSSCSKDNLEICPRLLLLYGWLTKALILRGGDVFIFWLQKIMVALVNPDYCYDGTEAIKLIMSENTDYLTRKQHCRVNHLYKQRMFQIFLSMSEKLENLDVKIKEAYLTSWAHVLNGTPKTVLNNDIVKIAPLVIDSLEYKNKDLLIVMLDLLSHIVQTYHVIVSGSLQTILPRLIKLSSAIDSMDVRIKSLQCLYDIANCYPTVLLLPHKQDILTDLAPSLDDKKRLVRNMAVRARTRWYLIGAPGESKDN